MGLDIVCKCGKINFRAGSYTGFHWFRKELAKRLGFDLEQWWCSGAKTNKPLKYFLKHSDCDGFLTPQQCKKMVPQMRQFLKEQWKQQKNPWYRILGQRLPDEEEAYFLELCQLWLEAFEHSAMDKCKLIFC